MSKILVCTQCGYIGRPKNAIKGNIAIELFLWLFFIIPGLIYSVWRSSSRHKVCPKCGNKNLIPLDSPKAQKMVKEELTKEELENIEKKQKEAKKETKKNIKKILIGVGIFILLIIIISSISSNNKESKSVPTNSKEVSNISDTIPEESIQALNNDLNGWAEGRWTDVVVGQSDGELLVRVYAQSGANEVAINGYCKVLKDSATKYIPSGHKLNLFIYQNGEVAKACS